MGKKSRGTRSFRIDDSSAYALRSGRTRSHHLFQNGRQIHPITHDDLQQSRGLQDLGDHRYVCRARGMRKHPSHQRIYTGYLKCHPDDQSLWRSLSNSLWRRYLSHGGITDGCRRMGRWIGLCLSQGNCDYF